MEKIQLHFTKAQAQYLRDILQNPLLDEPTDSEPTEQHEIRWNLFNGFDNALKAAYHPSDEAPKVKGFDFDAHNALVSKQTDVLTNNKQHLYISIVNGLCALGTHNSSISKEANEIYKNTIHRLEYLGKE